MSQDKYQANMQNPNYPQVPPQERIEASGDCPPQQGCPNQGFGPPVEQHMAPGHGHQQSDPPIMNQPTGQGNPNNAQIIPQGPLNCPPGLEYLTMIDQVLVQQKVEVLEVVFGVEMQNQYTIKNILGQKIYHAKEKSDCCVRNMCGPLRPFDMKISDNSGQEVIRLSRPLACGCCCFPCCLQSIEVSAPPGTVVGTVVQEPTCSPRFAINNASGDTVLRIERLLCAAGCGDVDFNVMSVDGTTKVGKITKQWSGLLREAFTDADNFGITFPIDLDVRMKAVMLGACFLIDFSTVYFFVQEDCCAILSLVQTCITNVVANFVADFVNSALVQLQLRLFRELYVDNQHFVLYRKSVIIVLFGVVHITYKLQ